MARGKVLVAGIVAVAVVSGCESKPEPRMIHPQSPIAPMAETEESGSQAMVAQSRYRVYRWMTTREMVDARIGYDPSLSAATRRTVEQAVGDDLNQKGYREGEPADFVVAFSDAYIDLNRIDPGGPLAGPAIAVTESPDGGGVWGYSGMETYRYPEESFTILFFDAETRRLVWRGWGKEKLYGFKQDDQNVAAAVYRALAPMPSPLGR